MVLNKGKRENITENGVEGGVGELFLGKLTDCRVSPANVVLYAHAKLEPGASLGYHIHRGESEIYYILSGKGLYSDNGAERQVEPGDVTYTPDGEGHGLENTGNEVLEFMALIVKD